MNPSICKAGCSELPLCEAEFRRVLEFWNYRSVARHFGKNVISYVTKALGFETGAIEG